MTVAVAESTTTLSEVAREAMTACNGDPKEAAKSMREIVMSDPALSRAMLDTVVDAGCWRYVRNIMQNQRTSAWNWSAGAKKDPVSSDNGLALLATANVMSLLDYPMSDGTRLGEASKELLLHDAQMLESHIKTMAHRARWFNAIAGKLPKNKIVQQVFTNDALERLRTETEGGASSGTL